jgi:hypothetical protein
MNRRDAMNAEILRGIFSASIASLRLNCVLEAGSTLQATIEPSTTIGTPHASPLTDASDAPRDELVAARGTAS